MNGSLAFEPTSMDMCSPRVVTVEVQDLLVCTICLALVKPPLVWSSIRSQQLEEVVVAFGYLVAPVNSHTVLSVAKHFHNSPSFCSLTWARAILVLYLN